MKNNIIVFIGGMSESGKSHTGIYLEKKHNFQRIKIIKIQKKLMQINNIEYNENNFSESLSKLFKIKNIYLNFINLILEEAKDKNIVLESLYDKNIYLEIKKLHSQTFCIFLKANWLKRILREKRKTNLTFFKTLKKVKKKEKFKKNKNAHTVKVVSDFIIINNKNTQFLEKNLDLILSKIKNKSFL
ncbi:hypothetical protein [Mesomycoplasma neurolyticum]|uniref:Dephospho-CoA kinase n=1 Tax=Mesomycoplasma neurolyticum TaxID=2120 RepID=A0A449A5Y5_9BACT|nr:hypothetical protein [Mesomycoplasma neurolyticum]VEU59637.1 Uncharacterised protein [Mesomycoplasma neurolyticum]